MNSESLRGRIAVLTGASSGIGAAVACALAREDVHVALAARREDALLEVQAGLDHRGGEVRSLIAATDVADREQVKSLVARTEEELGPVDVLVNCAGIMYYTLVFFSNYTTPYSKVPCPTDRRRARGAPRAGLGGWNAARLTARRSSAGRFSSLEQLTHNEQVSG